MQVFRKFTVYSEPFSYFFTRPLFCQKKEKKKKVITSVVLLCVCSYPSIIT